MGGNGREVTGSWRRRPIDRGGKRGDQEMVHHGDMDHGAAWRRRDGEGKGGELKGCNRWFGKYCYLCDLVTHKNFH